MRQIHKRGEGNVKMRCDWSDVASSPECLQPREAERGKEQILS